VKGIPKHVIFLVILEEASEDSREASIIYAQDNKRRGIQGHRKADLI
jgi:hypothetical protein